MASNNIYISKKGGKILCGRFDNENKFLGHGEGLSYIQRHLSSNKNENQFVKILEVNKITYKNNFLTITLDKSSYKDNNIKNDLEKLIKIKKSKDTNFEKEVKNIVADKKEEKPKKEINFKEIFSFFKKEEKIKNEIEKEPEEKTEINLKEKFSNYIKNRKKETKEEKKFRKATEKDEFLASMVNINKDVEYVEGYGYKFEKNGFIYEEIINDKEFQEKCEKETKRIKDLFLNEKLQTAIDNEREQVEYENFIKEMNEFYKPTSELLAKVNKCIKSKINIKVPKFLPKFEKTKEILIEVKDVSKETIFATYQYLQPIFEEKSKKPKENLRKLKKEYKLKEAKVKENIIKLKNEYELNEEKIKEKQKRIIAAAIVAASLLSTTARNVKIPQEDYYFDQSESIEVVMPRMATNNTTKTNAIEYLSTNDKLTDKEKNILTDAKEQFLLYINHKKEEELDDQDDKIKKKM